MNNLAFNGEIFLNNLSLELSNEFTFKKQLLAALDADQLSIKEYNGYITYSFLCEYIEARFRFYVTFHDHKKIVILIWCG